MSCCVWAQAFSGSSESSSVKLGTVSCPPSFFHDFFSHLSSFFFYTYFLLVCLKKKSSLGPLWCYFFFFSGFLFFPSFFAITFLHSLSALLFFFLGFVCVSVFLCSGVLSQFFRLSHLPNFSFHEMGRDGRSHRVLLATSWKLMQ